ncbi:MAG: polysaccharide biosynthesis tyrosine autokinase [Verrucomicrobiota bacterium]|nr:polysaccharide biosynthesis tyrosine autokinase [Verrucomicrobiota bacterium]
MARDKNTNDSSKSYGGYYYGEGYSNYAEAAFTPTRGIKDYLLILRERVWWFVAVSLVTFLGVAIYTLNSTKIFASQATVQVLRQQDKAVQFDDVVDMTVRNSEDFNTQVRIADSAALIARVADRMKGKLENEFMSYFRDEGYAWKPGRNLPTVLIDSKKISAIRQTLVIQIQFRHPNPEIAAKVANLFAEEFIRYNLDLRLEGARRAWEENSQNANAEKKKLQEIEIQMAQFKEKYKSVSFDAVSDTDTRELIDYNQLLTQDKKMLDESETQWNLVEQLRRDGRDLWELPFISINPQVSELLTRRSMIKIEVASLSKHYRVKHPKMAEAIIALNACDEQLTAMVNASAEGIYNNLRRARENYKNTDARIAAKKEELIAIDKIRVEYNALQRNLKATQDYYDYLYKRAQQTLAQSSDEATSVRIIDYAGPALEPSSPDVLRNLALGLFGGIALGLGFVFILALLDDKVKSAFDIETTIGLPLIGIIPRISRADAHMKARMVADGTDKHTVEAFRGIYSTLKLNEESKKAKVVLVTSTIPSEGKSFVSTNIALTFAAHGEKTIVIDADLRMPNVAKSLDIDNKQGILQIMKGEKTLDEVILKDFWTNTDVLVTGGRTKNPTQILTSEKFESLIHELRLRYDKIIIDSPPLAPVSDALNILPLADGVVYVIRFNVVKRKTANLNVRRLRESNVPVFGAVLNNINTAVAGYYYSHYYDKSYAHYYIDPKMAEDELETASGKPAKKPIDPPPLPARKS